MILSIPNYKETSDLVSVIIDGDEYIVSNFRTNSYVDRTTRIKYENYTNVEFSIQNNQNQNIHKIKDIFTHGKKFDLISYNFKSMGCLIKNLSFNQSCVDIELHVDYTVTNDIAYKREMKINSILNS